LNLPVLVGKTIPNHSFIHTIKAQSLIMLTLKGRSKMALCSTAFEKNWIEAEKS